MHLLNSSGLLGCTANRRFFRLCKEKRVFAIKQIKSEMRGKKKRHCSTKRYLKWYFRRHGETVSDDGLFLCGATFPAVQLDAAATRQKDLLVHLHWRVPGELASCTPQRNKQHLRPHRSPQYHGMCVHVSRARHELLSMAGESHPPRWH